MAERKRASGAHTRSDSLRKLERVLDRFSDVRLLVVGDVILDEYLTGDTDRISPEAPVPVVRVRGESAVLGGAGNVARNVVALGGECALVAAVGEDRAGRQILDLLEALGIGSRGVVVLEGRETSHKTRIVARAQQILRYDRESEAPLSRADTAALLARARTELSRASGVVLEDYGKGTLTPGLARRLVREAAAACVPVAVDPKRDLAPYRGASLIKPNLAEAQDLTGIRLAPGESADALLTRLAARCPGAEWAVTRGGRGMLLRTESGRTREVPTVQREVFDVQGAGDTSIAALWLARLAGATLEEAAVIANAAAGVVVGKIGTAAATCDEVRAMLPAAIAAARGVV